MKITILCVVVMLFLGVANLQSVEFGENSEEGFRFRHHLRVELSVPITNIKQVSAPVGYEIGVDLKEEPAGPDSLAYNDNRGAPSTTSVQLILGSDKNIRYIYYCEELFVVKHKSNHSCVSAIFYNLGPSVVTENCKFHNMFNATVPPVILDGGKEVLLAKLLWTKITEMCFTEWRFG